MCGVSYDIMSQINQNLASLHGRRADLAFIVTGGGHFSVAENYERSPDATVIVSGVHSNLGGALLAEPKTMNAPRS